MHSSERGYPARPSMRRQTTRPALITMSGKGSRRWQHWTLRLKVGNGSKYTADRIAPSFYIRVGCGGISAPSSQLACFMQILHRVERLPGAMSAAQRGKGVSTAGTTQQQRDMAAAVGVSVRHRRAGRALGPIASRIPGPRQA
jgi:hypothetical protein